MLEDVGIRVDAFGGEERAVLDGVRTHGERVGDGLGAVRVHGQRQSGGVCLLEGDEQFCVTELGFVGARLSGSCCRRSPSP